jgi:hypothetical protein
VNEQVSALPLLSPAVQTTGVVPFENRVPEAGTHVMNATVQLSDAFAENVTRASHTPGSVTVRMLAGQMTVGFSRS